MSRRPVLQLHLGILVAADRAQLALDGILEPADRVTAAEELLLKRPQAEEKVSEPEGRP